MKISVIKSANEVVIGSWQITNEKLAKLMITINDAKNNLKKRRYTHWVKVSFNGVGSIELGDEPMCIGDYDEYPISPDTKVIIPIEDGGECHKQYVCSQLNTLRVLQHKTLTENEEIIMVYTEILDEQESRAGINEMLLNAMKKCLFEYQMKAYTDYANEPMDKACFNQRIEQISNILPDLEALLIREGEEEEAQEEIQAQMPEEVKEEVKPEIELSVFPVKEETWIYEAPAKEEGLEEAEIDRGACASNTEEEGVAEVKWVKLPR